MGHSGHAACNRCTRLGFHDARRYENWWCNGLVAGCEPRASQSIRLSNHLWPEISAQLLCLAPTAHWLEYVDWWNPIMSEPLEINKGMANIEGSMGSGVAWNEKAVERFSA